MPQRESPYHQMKQQPTGQNSYIHHWTDEKTGVPMQARIPGLCVRNRYKEISLEHSVTGLIESCGRRQLRYLIFQANELLYTGLTTIYGNVELAIEAAQVTIENWHTNHFQEIKPVTEDMFGDEDLDITNPDRAAQAELGAMAYAFERYARSKQQGWPEKDKEELGFNAMSEAG